MLPRGDLYMQCGTRFWKAHMLLLNAACNWATYTLLIKASQEPFRK